MDIIPFVKKEHNELARAVESKLLELPLGAGILFVGVDVSRTEPKEDPIYRLLIGIARDSKLEEAVIRLATLTLASELLTGADIQIEVRRVVSRG